MVAALAVVAGHGKPNATQTARDLEYCQKRGNQPEGCWEINRSPKCGGRHVFEAVIATGAALEIDLTKQVQRCASGPRAKGIRK